MILTEILGYIYTLVRHEGQAHNVLSNYKNMNVGELSFLVEMCCHAGLRDLRELWELP